MRLSPLLLVLALGCNHEGEEEEEAPAPKHVRCEPVKVERLTDLVELRGTIAPLPDRNASLAPQVAGRILEVSVREGDEVAIDQPLAKIDAARFQDQAAEMNAALGKAKAEVESAKATLGRVQRLFDHGIAARQEVDDASLRLANAQAQEAEARSQAQRARRELDWTTLRSSIAGTVLKVLKHPGELVDGTPATPIVEIADVSQLELAGDAAAQDLVRIAKGQTATITSSALPDSSWRGVVAAVAPAVDRTTGLGRVRVSLSLSADHRPPVGVLALARIAVGSPREAIVVPRTALRSRSGSDVEVIECAAGVAKVARVKRGVESGGEVEIREGIDRSARIVVEGVVGIGDGDPLEVEK